MIEYIHLINFQSHKDTYIDFSENITTIVGSTDIGKSAIVRALRWVLFNKPGGNAFITRGKKECSVTVGINGKDITRIRGKKTNEYHFNGEVFTAFGANVPETISQHINVSVHSLQSQHDAPYWLSLSSGQLGKAINSIVDLSQIDAGLGYLKKEHRTSKIKLELIDKQIKKAREEKKRYNVIPELDTGLEHLERLESDVMASREKCEAIESAITSIVDAKQRMKGISRRLKIGKRYIASLDVLREEIESSTSKIGYIETAIESIVELERDIKNISSKIEQKQRQLKRYKICPKCKRPLNK